MSDIERGPGEAQAAHEQGEGDPNALAVPSDVQATRGRMQGLGVGQRELDAQRDPDRDKDEASFANQVHPETDPPYPPSSDPGS